MAHTLVVVSDQKAQPRLGFSLLIRHDYANACSLFGCGTEHEPTAYKARSLLHADQPEPALVTNHRRVEARTVVFDCQTQVSVNTGKAYGSVGVTRIFNDVPKCLLGDTVERCCNRQRHWIGNVLSTKEKGYAMSLLKI